MKEAWLGSRGTFLNFGVPSHIFGMGEASHFKFYLQIDTDEY